MLLREGDILVRRGTLLIEARLPVYRGGGGVYLLLREVHTDKDGGMLLIKGYTAKRGGCCYEMGLTLNRGIY